MFDGDELTPEQQAAQAAEQKAAQEQDEKDFEAEFSGAAEEEVKPTAAPAEDKTEPPPADKQPPAEEEGNEDDGEQPPADQDEDKTKPPAEPEKPDPMAAMEERINKRMRNLEGHIGGIKSTLQNLSTQQKQDAAAKAAAAADEAGAEKPTRAQITEAMKTGDKFKALAEEFPEWAAAMEESMALVQSEVQSELEKHKPAPVDLSSVTREVRELIQIDLKHPGWEEAVTTDEFGQWMSGQPEEVQQLANSNKAKDAIRMLDLYAEHTKQQQAAAETAAAKNKKLEDAVAPTGDKRKPPVKSEEDEFVEAFNNT